MLKSIWKQIIENFKVDTGKCFRFEIEKGFACDENELHGLASGASAASKDKGQRGFLGGLGLGMEGWPDSLCLPIYH